MVLEGQTRPASTSLRRRVHYDRQEAGLVSSRDRIIRLLGRGPQTEKELSRALVLHHKTVWCHLKTLIANGLVSKLEYHEAVKRDEFGRMVRHTRKYPYIYKIVEAGNGKKSQ